VQLLPEPRSAPMIAREFYPTNEMSHFHRSLVSIKRKLSRGGGHETRSRCAPNRVARPRLTSLRSPVFHQPGAREPKGVMLISTIV
jgi:hypothetical protein